MLGLYPYRTTRASMDHINEHTLPTSNRASFTQISLLDFFRAGRRFSPAFVPIIPPVERASGFKRVGQWSKWLKGVGVTQRASAFEIVEFRVHHLAVAGGLQWKSHTSCVCSACAQMIHLLNL